MSAPASHEITQLLLDWSHGDQAALEKLTPLIEADLRRIAKREFRKEKVGHTLQPTVLVGEVFIKLLGASQVGFKDRAHFFATCATMMRHILVDYARRKASEKLGGGVPKLALDDALCVAVDRSCDLVALDDALQTLEQLDPRQAQIVVARFFGGLTVEEVAEEIGLSVRHVGREWELARTWLYRELSREAENRDADETAGKP